MKAGGSSVVWSIEKDQYFHDVVPISMLKLFCDVVYLWKFLIHVFVTFLKDKSINSRTKATHLFQSLRYLGRGGGKQLLKWYLEYLNVSIYLFICRFTSWVCYCAVKLFWWLMPPSPLCAFVLCAGVCLPVFHWSWWLILSPGAHLTSDADNLFKKNSVAETRCKSLRIQNPSYLNNLTQPSPTLLPLHLAISLLRFFLDAGRLLQGLEIKHGKRGLCAYCSCSSVLLLLLPVITDRKKILPIF